MYAYVKGVVASLTPEYVVIDVQGVGYKIAIPIHLYTRGLDKGAEVILYTAHVVREDAHRLFGFTTESERDFFEKLLQISGIGAKTALSLLGHLDAKQLKAAIQMGQTDILVRVPGIGKKTAERIIVELGDRIGKWNMPETATPTRLVDALSALVNLGYNQQAAQKALTKVVDVASKELPLSEMITGALKHL